MTIEELYERWLRLCDRYRSLIAGDPDMLASTEEAEQLCDRRDRAWHEYYAALCSEL